jgi:hypothetical protein
MTALASAPAAAMLAPEPGHVFPDQAQGVVA